MITTLNTSSPVPKKTSLKPTTTKAYQSVNPYDGEVFRTFEEMTDPQLETAIQTAENCFETWRISS